MLVGIGLTLVSLWYGQNHGLMPAEASVEAPIIDGLFNLMLTIGTGLFLLVQGVIVVSIIRFRRREGDMADALEILWTAIPAVIVLMLSVYSFDVYGQIGGLGGGMDHSMAHHSAGQHQMVSKPGAAIAAPLPDSMAPLPQNAIADAEPSGIGGKTAPDSPTYNPPSAKAPYEIQTMGLQYAWLFTYPDTGIVSGELHVPVGREIVLNISAQDVIHAFWVPEYRLKQDAIPGQQTQIRFTPKTAGEYPVICAELCGPYHGAMKTKVIAETPEDFATWVQEQKVASVPGLEQAIAATNLAEQTPDQFLEPFVQQSFGVEPSMLHQLHSMSHAAQVHASAS